MRLCGAPIVGRVPRRIALGGHDDLVVLGRRNTRKRQPDRPEAAAALPDVWVQERLAGWTGRVLSQFRVSSVSLILDFWEVDDDFTAWLYADEIQVDGLPLGPRVGRTSSEAVGALHALLGREVSTPDVSGGRLRFAFREGLALRVDPQPDAQAWALAFEQGGSITCEPGGALDVRVD